jgi:hypothetical protein
MLLHEPIYLSSFQTQMENTRMSTRSEFEFKYWVISLAAALALIPVTANATLGEAESSVALDSQQLQSSVKMSERGTYRVHELQLASGTLVREFAAPNGTVFAVAWKGPSLPNLRQTLGRYFDSYTAGAEANRLGHTHMQFEQDGLVVEASGHMRAFTGRAYLPQAVPAGTSLDEVR